MISDDVTALVARTRADQGMPERITDAATLHLIADALRAERDGPRPREPGARGSGWGTERTDNGTARVRQVLGTVPDGDAGGITPTRGGG